MGALTSLCLFDDHEAQKAGWNQNKGRDTTYVTLFTFDELGGQELVLKTLKDVFLQVLVRQIEQFVPEFNNWKVNHRANTKTTQ